METFLLSLNVVIVAQSALIISQIFTRPKRLVSDYALMAFFATIVAVDLPYLVLQTYGDALPNWYWFTTQAFWSLVPLLCLPALWWYTVTLTALKPIVGRRFYLWHLVPFGMGCLLFLPFVLLESGSKLRVMTDAAEFSFGEGMAELGLVIVDLLWVLCSAAYLFVILRRIRSYRRKLKDVFASTEDREMAWLYALSFAMVLFWGSLVGNMIADVTGWPTAVPDILNELIDVGVVWALCVWGLRQRPGFEGVDVDELETGVESVGDIENENLEREKSSVEKNETPQKAKYEKSALSEEQAKRIALKIEDSMANDFLYRDSMISLSTLAKRTGVSSNYISQTLNVILEQTFFEYVNGWRIREAESALLETDETVLNIAMNTGFNSRSSFYKAFRAEHGTTPSAFRKEKSVA